MLCYEGPPFTDGGLWQWASKSITSWAAVSQHKHRHFLCILHSFFTHIHRCCWRPWWLRPEKAETNSLSLLLLLQDKRKKHLPRSIRLSQASSPCSTFVLTFWKHNKKKTDSNFSIGFGHACLCSCTSLYDYDFFIFHRIYMNKNVNAGSVFPKLWGRQTPAKKSSQFIWTISQTTQVLIGIVFQPFNIIFPKTKCTWWH